VSETSADFVEGPHAVEVFERVVAGDDDGIFDGDAGDDVGDADLVGIGCGHDPSGDVERQTGDVPSAPIDLAGVDPDPDRQFETSPAHA
jgi:hypothetical protein